MAVRKTLFLVGCVAALSCAAQSALAITAHQQEEIIDVKNFVRSAGQAIRFGARKFLGVDDQEDAVDAKHEADDKKEADKVPVIEKTKVVSTSAPHLCNMGAVDVVAVLDSSSSVSERLEWPKMKSMLLNSLASFDFDKAKARLGVVKYSSQAHLSWGLDSQISYTLSKLRDNISNLEYIAGATATPTALHLAADTFRKMETDEPERFKHSTKILIVATDGSTNRWRKREFSSLDEEMSTGLERIYNLPHVHVFVLGIHTTHQNCVTEWKRIARCDLNDVKYCKNIAVADWDDIITQLPAAIGEICEEASTAIPDVEDNGGKKKCCCKKKKDTGKKDKNEPVPEPAAEPFLPQRASY